MIHPRTLRSLEFDRVLERLASLCASERARAAALAVAPLRSEEDAAEARRLFDEYLSFAADAGRSPGLDAGAFPDPVPFVEEIAEKGAAGASLDPDAFWALKGVLLSAARIREAICRKEGEERWPRLMALATTPPPPHVLAGALARCLGDDGRLRDESSPELFRVRVEVRNLHRTALGRARAFAESHGVLPYLQDEFMTLSSDRYVLPFKAAYKNRMQGIIHDWSQTGETCYFEPLFLVELNNRIQELRREEREEERRVFQWLASLVEAEAEGALGSVRLLVEMDLLRAKRRLAEATDGRMVPHTPASEGILLAGARHPLLLLAELDAGGRTRAMSRIRPLDIVFRPSDRAVIVTGGNAGGKTVCLKTLGLCAAMTQAGLPVPAGPGSHLPWFGRIDAFIGDEQSLEDNVSTFTAQIEHLAKAWRHLDADALALLDEFGSGTDPSQGAALAQALLDELLAKRAFVLTATHFPALKGYALATEGARAASMLFDAKTRKPLYALAYDQIGSSQALDVAREHGLPESILKRAAHYLLQDGEDASALLRRLNDLAVERAGEVRALEEERARGREAEARLRARLEEERRRLQDEVRAKAQDLMRAWKEEKVSHRQALRRMAAIRAELAKGPAEEEAPAPPAAPAVGDRVTHSLFRKSGTVTEVDERRGRVRLDLGGVTMWADLGLVSAGASGEARAAKPASGAGQAQSARHAADAAWTVDLRGMRADEAIDALTAFLDKAWLAEIGEVEIVHGRGTGALRKAVHAWLADCPRVSSHALAPADRGGDGMTVATLR